MNATQFMRVVCLIAGVLACPFLNAAQATPKAVAINPCLLLTAAEEAEFDLTGAEKKIKSVDSTQAEGRPAERLKFQSCNYKLTTQSRTTQIQVVLIAPAEDRQAAQAMLDELSATATPGSPEYVPGAVWREIDGGACSAIPFFGAFTLSTCLGIRNGLVLWVVLREPNLEAGKLSTRVRTLFEDVALRIGAAGSLTERAVSLTPSANQRVNER